MRFLLPLLILAGCTSLNPASGDQMETVETVVEHSHTQADAFNRLERWVAETYVSANDVIQLNDEEEGTLVVRGAAEVSMGDVLSTMSILVGYTMTIDVRDNRVRFRQTIGQAIGGGNVTNAAAEDMIEHFELLRLSALAAMEEDDGF